MRFVSPAAILALSATLSACSAGGGRIVGPTPDGSGPLPDAGALPDGSVISDAAPPDARELPDAMPIDPFDPASACGSSAIPTERVPGSLLILFDRSGSMSDPPSSSGGMISKWDLSKSAINTALAAQPDALGVGLMLFPTGEGSECSVSLSPTVPHVPIDLLGTTRALITSELNASGAGGGNTPIFSALAAGYDYLDTLSTPGQRGLLLVTDGAETCDPMSTDAILARALAEREANGYLTFAVGLTQNNNILSTLAVNGGTPRNDSCLATCTAETCYSDADCGGAACEKPTDLFPLPGVLNLP
ncbi:MAG: VWA domain-containing protein, partial [Myxococcales bacterium]|nr:VWA domain-containing protein [Myxococcales bacterium]